jgi:hypothetical protein
MLLFGRRTVRSRHRISADHSMICVRPAMSKNGVCGSEFTSDLPGTIEHEFFEVLHRWENTKNPSKHWGFSLWGR